MGKEEKEKTADLITEDDSREMTAAGERTAAEEPEKEETADRAEEGGDKEGRGRRREQKNGRKKKAKKANHAARTFLRILQHASLALMVVSVFIVAIGSSVRVEGFRSKYGFNMYSMDRKQKYEESELFDNIFGYAAADIIRHGVVSGQLESEGSFDGRKVIDVTAYNYRDIGLPERYVTASYYLEDLLKWQNYGFEWSGTEMTAAQAQDFLADRTRVTVIDPDSKYYNTSDASYLKSDVESYTFVDDVSSNQLIDDTEDPDGFVDDYRPAKMEVTVSEDGEVSSTVSVLSEVEDDHDSGEKDTYNVMINRYKTTEGKNLEEYVSDWDLYYDLCHNVQYAAQSLSYNYTEYLEAKRYYSIRNSNVRYLICKTVGENTQIYTNLEEEQDIESLLSFADTEEEAQGETFLRAGKYIYYSPADMTYETNTSITEETIRQILQEYDYAYPETVEIWVGVDTSYPADDAFTQGRAGFDNYQPYFMQWIVLALGAGVLYFVLLCYLTFVTGKDADKEGRTYIRLTSFDKIPTEIMFLLGFGMMILIAWVMIVAAELLNLNALSILSYDTVAHAQWFQGALFATVFVVDVVAMFFFYSLVRRWRAKTLWKNSYLCRLFKLLKRGALLLYDNSNIVLRTCIPYGVFLLFNLLMCIWAFGSDGFGMLLALFTVMAVDIAVGHLLYKNAKEQQQIVKGIETIANGQLEHQVKTDKLHGDNLTLAHSVNSIGKGIKEAVEISMKDERMKADLITNVSHDIKTPLTSIINYVDLIKRERIDNEKVKNYIKVLDEKSQRLKQLTDDLVEASKITSGNISLHFEQINLTELMNQTIGEFSEKFEQKNLTTVMNVRVKNAVIEADSRRIWRVMENLFNNIYKYAMEGTRVYLSIEDMPDKKKFIVISIKNISASPLNCNPDELTERFIRGDVSRTTEGSGLGLSIAKNLTEAQKGTFEINLDGDLFKVLLTFPKAKEEKKA